jgi:hypothetical protein
MIDFVEVHRCRHSQPEGQGIQFCPLYVAGHIAGLPTCVTGDWALGCAVARGNADYDALIERLRAQRPDLVDECELEKDWAERKREYAERVAQRKRNCVNNGIRD